MSTVVCRSPCLQRQKLPVVAKENLLDPKMRCVECVDFNDTRSMSTRSLTRLCSAAS
jgi:hypothetical protein